MEANVLRATETGADDTHIPPHCGQGKVPDGPTRSPS